MSRANASNSPVGVYDIQVSLGRDMIEVGMAFLDIGAGIAIIPPGGTRVRGSGAALDHMTPGVITHPGEVCVWIIYTDVNSNQRAFVRTTITPTGQFGQWTPERMEYLDSSEDDPWDKRGDSVVFAQIGRAE
jgi:hypothetical protein